MDNANTPSMRSMASPWPSLVRRLRFLSNLKQADLAELLGVDPTSVSRWERNLCTPDTAVQKRVRDMLCTLEPAIKRSFIEHCPGLVVVARLESTGYISALSPAGAAPYNRTPKDMRDLAVYDITSESVRAFFDEIDSNTAWCHGEISMLQAIVHRPDGNWVRFNFTPIGNTGHSITIGVVVPPPHTLECKDYQLIIHPFDELCD